jgi:hypothetical protein
VKNGKRIPANIGVEAGFERGNINYCQVYAKTMWMPLWTGATIVKKEIFVSENGFKPTLKLGEDFDLWVRVSMKHPVALLNKPLANYNQDVLSENSAVALRFYKPEEHMMFTDYGNHINNEDFRKLYEVLAVYDLLPYYLYNKNYTEVKAILKIIHWKNHSFKYLLYYKIIPKSFLRFWFGFETKIYNWIKN